MPNNNKEPRLKKGHHQHGTTEHSPPRTVPGLATVAAPPTLGAPKTVYLIRHGESLGQRASRKARSHDINLNDCALSNQGVFQATVIPSLFGSERYSKIDYVVSSPLTRAVQTSVLGFPSKEIVIHYDLYEMGGKETNVPIPENRPRHLKDVLADTGGKERIDGTTFAPIHMGFPKSHRKMSNKNRKDRLRRVWPKVWQFCEERKYETIAVVCHFNIIRMAFSEYDAVQPENAIPIECLLHSNGGLELVNVLGNPVQELTAALAQLKERNNDLMETGTEGMKEAQEHDDGGYMVSE